MSGLTLVVMAAGIGSRYGGLKQVEPIGPTGEWIIDYSVFDAVRAGFERVVFVVRSEIEGELRERFGRTLGGICPVDYVVQSLDDLPTGFSPPTDRVKPWGTGHAVWSCRGVIGGPIGVINADDFYGRDAFDAIVQFLELHGAKRGSDYALVGRKIERMLSPHGHVSRGICYVDEHGYLLRIEERHGVGYYDGEIGYLESDKVVVLPSGVMASMSMWGFTGEVLGELDDLLVEFFSAEHEQLLHAELPISAVVDTGKHKLQFIESADHWFGLTHRQDVAEVRRETIKRTAKGEYPSPLW